jgi:hypothetical protein
MNDLQTLLAFLRGLPEVGLLEDAVKALAAADGGREDDSFWSEAEDLKYDCELRAMDLQEKLDSLGINYETQWGVNNNWSVRLGTNDRTFGGGLLPGPVIADCRISVGSYFTE